MEDISMAWKFECEDKGFPYWEVKKRDKIQGLRVFLWISHRGKETPWYSYQHKKWVSDTNSDVFGVMGGSNTYGCSTFRHFRKHLDSHPELRTQGDIVLVSRFLGFNVIARWEE